MRLLLGLIVLFVGMAIVLYGIGGALLEVVSLYQGALNNPLAETDSGEVISGRMISSLTTGALGLPFLLLGTLLLRSHRRRRRFR